MGKRLGREADTLALLKSDSDDADYDGDASARSPRKSRKLATNKRKKAATRTKRKNHTQQYDSGTDDDISDVVSEDDIDFSDDGDESPNVQYGANGRPVRGAVAKKPKTYKEPSDDEDDKQHEDIESASSHDDDEGEGPRRSAAVKKPPGPLVITLKYGNRHLVRLEEDQDLVEPEQLQPTRRLTRASSATPAQTQRAVMGGKGPLKSGPGKKPAKTRGRGVSAEPSRRSSRLGHTDEPMAALSDSGHHVVITNLHVPVPPEIQDVEEPKKQELEQISAIEEEPELSSAELSNGNSAPLDLEVRESQPDQPEATTEVSHNVSVLRESVSRDDTGHEADEDEDDGPTKRTRTRTGTSGQVTASPKPLRSGGEPVSADYPEASGSRRLERRSKSAQESSRKGNARDDDEYREEGGGEDSDDSMSSVSHSPIKPARAQGYGEDNDEYSDARSSKGNRKRHRNSASEDHESQAELAAELEELRPSPKRSRRTQRRVPQFSGNESGTAAEPRLRRRTQHVDYRILRPEMAAVLDDNDGGTSTPSKRKTGSALAHSKSLFDTNGPFGGGEVVPFFGRSAAPIDIDSDSSDDDAIRRRGRANAGTSGTVGMTPAGVHAPGLLPGVGQTHNADPLQAGAPANLGRITKPGKNALADADPLGISPDVTFDSVGGLDDRIQQLKEMVMLPLMYPEIFKAKKVVPPRGVLFHGPPGTGKTLLARAVASSFTGSDGKKVTFYMRKGADCLSKWVGEAERQLRLLFDEARSNQPSIIFFDEIDGLAPVRSSKQEQIHASIVSTLLALMDGMDGRGQVVVIGATNRPDAIDPALRRPGRFDREFYFPLPTTESRRSIIEIHSKGWEPPLSDAFKDQLAALTKGYGGADLRALCTEAALNAMQRTYPQIYKSLDKLKVDPASVVVTARDFMMSLKKITPSSERSSASGASPLPEHIEPLLSRQLDRIKECLKGIFPEFKRLTPLEEAEYEDDTLDAEEGFEREMMMENFESARVYRPRLLIHGVSGLGQQYLAAAVLHFMEKVHVQSFDLGTLLSDAARAPETAVVQFFTEIKRHKPSVIFIPNVDVWYRTLPETAIATFKGLLQSVSPNDRVLLFGISEAPVEDLDDGLTQDLFGYSRRDRFELERPDENSRFLYFDKVISHIQKSPRDFPQDPRNRKKRKLPELERASPPPQLEQTDDEKRAIALKDRQLKNHLKIRLNNLVENLKQKYRRFKKPVIEHEVVMRSLVPPPPDPNSIQSDIPPPPQQHRFRAFEDDDRVLRVEDTLTKKVYFNIDLDVIEDRFSNGYYSTPRQFLVDLERIRHDAKLVGDKENQRKANEMLTNSEVYIADIEMDTVFVAQCEEMHERAKKRTAERAAQAEKKKIERQKMIEAAADTANQEASAEHGENVGIGGASHDVPTVLPKPPAPKNIMHGYSVLSNGAPSDTGATVSTSQHPPSNRDSDLSSMRTPIHHNMMAPGQSTQLTKMGSETGGSVAVTRVAPMDLSTIVNDASTTTSGGKRTSDGTASQPHSNPYSNHSNGYGAPPIDQPHSWGDFGIPGKGDSQLPATQVLFSQGQQSPQGYPASQAIGHIFPYSQPDSSLASVPNPTQVFHLPPPPLPVLVCTRAYMNEIHNKLAKATSGYTVEQLEQVNAAIMDHVWKSKANYNRDDVARRAMEVFEDVNSDIKEMQMLLPVSGSFE